MIIDEIHFNYSSILYAICNSCFVHLLIFILFALFVCLFVYYYYYYSIVIVIGYNYHRWPVVMELPFWQPAVV